MRTALAIACFCCISPAFLAGETVRIAVAANFRDTLDALASAFSKDNSEIRLAIVSGSTGNLYAQIANGAPYDAFFSADSQRPELLEANRLSIPHTRFTYAIGTLALILPQPAADEATVATLLLANPKEKVALANPDLAPYGLASVQSLDALELRPALADRLVFGANVSQAFHYSEAKTVTFAFVAYPQLLEKAPTRAHWIVPETFHEPIVQQAVLLRENEAARSFLEFCRSDEGKTLIAQAGYRLPH